MYNYINGSDSCWLFIFMRLYHAMMRPSMSKTEIWTTRLSHSWTVDSKSHLTEALAHLLPLAFLDRVAV